MTRRTLLPIFVFALSLPALGQDSSLYVNPDPGSAAAARFGRPDVVPGFVPKINPHVARLGIAVVTQPQPKVYRVNDLVTILVRESFESSADASLETEKSIEAEGEISDFPRLSLSDLLDLQLRPNTFPNGTPKVGVEFGREFEGEGAAARKDTMTGRITARVIDVKPNGTLVLEARKHVQSDKEAMTVIATGLCRAVDVSPLDNTILSSNLYDLHIVKKTSGELHKATKKGLLTKILEGLFAF